MPVPDYKDDLVFNPDDLTMPYCDIKELREQIKALKDKVHILKEKLAQRAPELEQWLNKNFSEEE